MSERLEHDLRRLAERDDVRGADEVWHRATHRSPARRLVAVGVAAAVVVGLGIAGSLALDDDERQEQSVAAGTRVSVVAVETDGLLPPVVAAGDRLVAATGAGVVASTDGRTWEPVDLPGRPEGAATYDVGVEGGRVVARAVVTGSLGSGSVPGTVTSLMAWTTADGATWQETAAPVDWSVRSGCTPSLPPGARPSGVTATCSAVFDGEERIAEATGDQRLDAPVRFRDVVVVPVVDDGTVVELVVVAR